MENSCKGCKYFLNWRNAAINGTRLSIEGIQKLRDYTIPTSGALRLDYVTYRVGIRIGGGGVICDPTPVLRCSNLLGLCDVAAVTW